MISGVKFYKNTINVGIDLLRENNPNTDNTEGIDNHNWVSIQHQHPILHDETHIILRK